MQISIRRRTHLKFLERSIWIQYTTRCLKVILTCCTYNALRQFVSKSFPSFVDVNECLSRETFTCHQRVSCVNTNGFYFCVCHSGFTGDGKMICTGDDNLSLLRHKPWKEICANDIDFHLRASEFGMYKIISHIDLVHKLKTEEYFANKHCRRFILFFHRKMKTLKRPISPTKRNLKWIYINPVYQAKQRRKVISQIHEILTQLFVCIIFLTIRRRRVQR